ncbi:MAG: flavoprotein oxygenase DIM6NTAB family protein [Candidatus Scalindua rubra]|uniref:Flavoprotein oxygenase DIM6NTAB family protein n=1 Tax=Candidatus Scalindua rubra TaxID=1872076 RepID=A0A1E3X5C5_9BACT|nr:MAG: flavoprotein oxygenase DIM6NTAB family protein [Candidatus Scalindua rubra]
MKKIKYPIDKHDWHPSLIPGLIVLISSYNSEKESNIAPKSWLQMVSFEPPILMFSGTEGNTTEKNIIESNCFGVNFVDSSKASKVFDCIQWFGKERIEQTGFTMIRARKINAPLIQECKAHLECRLLSTIKVGSGFVIFGEIVAASIWEEILRVEHEKRYELLDPIVFLEDGMYSRINNTSKV